jgi:hypothetical protein
MSDKFEWVRPAVLLVLPVALVLLGSPIANAGPDGGYTRCLENGQVNTYINTFYPCPGRFGPSYGQGNHRWPSGEDD